MAAAEQVSRRLHAERPDLLQVRVRGPDRRLGVGPHEHRLRGRVLVLVLVLRGRSGRLAGAWRFGLGRRCVGRLRDMDALQLEFLLPRFLQFVADEEERGEEGDDRCVCVRRVFGDLAREMGYTPADACITSAPTRPALAAWSSRESVVPALGVVTCSKLASTEAKNVV